MKEIIKALMTVLLGHNVPFVNYRHGCFTKLLRRFWSDIIRANGSLKYSQLNLTIQHPDRRPRRADKVVGMCPGTTTWLTGGRKDTKAKLRNNSIIFVPAMLKSRPVFLNLGVTVPIWGHVEFKWGHLKFLVFIFSSNKMLHIFTLLLKSNWS